MYDERAESVRRARSRAPDLGHMELALRLEAEGWTYSPPKPVLPVVSEAAHRAFYSAMGMEGGLRAAFRVMLRENLERIGDLNAFPVRSNTWHVHLYHALTGEEWPNG